MPLEDRQLLQIIESAAAEGARGAEVLYSSRDTLTGRATGGRLADQGSDHTERVVLRVWLDGGREGVAVTERNNVSDQLPKLLTKALAKAEEADEDPTAGPVGRLSSPDDGLGLLDRRYSSTSERERLAVVADAERGARKVDRKVQTRDFLYEDVFVDRRFANSKGNLGRERGTLYRAQGTVTVGDVTLSQVLADRSWAGIASLPYGAVLAQRALALQGKVYPLPKGPLRVALSARLVAAIFGALAPAFDYAVLKAGKNALVGHTLSDKVHVLDDGSVAGALRTTAFDDRGVAPVALTLIRHGEVDGRFLDPSTARALDIRPTGHVLNDKNRARNLIVRGGSRSINAILSDGQGEVFQAEELHELVSCNPATGELELVVHGRAMNGTDELGVVRLARLKGSLIEVLSSVVDVSSDTDRFGHIDAPGYLLDGLSLV